MFSRLESEYNPNSYMKGQKLWHHQATKTEARKEDGRQESILFLWEEQELSQQMKTA